MVGNNLIHTREICTDTINSELLNEILDELQPIIRKNFGQRQFYLKIRVGKYLLKSEGERNSYRTFYSSHNTEVNSILISANINNYRKKFWNVILIRKI